MNRLIALFFLLMTFSGGRAFAASSEILASFSILGDLVKAIAPDEVSVGSLVIAGQDPHGFEPSVPDYVRLRKARLIFAVGAGFEPWLAKARESAGAKAPVVSLADELPLRPNGLSGKDPHFWQDPRLAEKAVEIIARELAKSDPKKTAEIQAKKEKYLKQLRELDKQVREEFAKLPDDHRLVITSHEAFDYFGNAYDLKFLAPQTTFSETEPSAKDVAKLVRQIKEKKARALFVENLKSRQTMEQIAHETGARIGGILYADSLTESGGEADTYLKLLKCNADRIREALR